MDLTFILTDACNLRCRYCYQPAFGQDVMPCDVAVEAMRNAVRHGAERLALTFFGGEPLLEDEALLAILTEARRLENDSGVEVTAKVSTNGTRLSEKFLAHAAEGGLFISLSHDGVKEAHDASRVSVRGEGSFEVVDRALRLLVAHGRPFGVYSVVTPVNVAYLAESREYLWEAGARILVTTLDYTAKWDRPAVRMLRRQYGSAFAGTMRLRRLRAASRNADPGGRRPRCGG